MKGYPVGSVVILQNAENFAELNGMEATLTGPLQERYIDILGRVYTTYTTDLVHKGYKVCPKHYQVRLKRMPPNTAFNSFLNKLLQPCGDLVEV